ncbi:MAG: hypothetical protein IBJ09_03720 [Bacteroidia bacterium]|nr:hypothetical protein [Bacteroidia bacterium]
MANSINIPITNFPTGQLIFWNVTAQTAGSYNVILQDASGENIYFNYTTGTYQPGKIDILGYGYVAVQSANLQLVITNTSGSSNFNSKNYSGAYPTDAGMKNVANNFVCLIEDGTDNDYNDIVVEIFGIAAGV